MTVAAYMAGEIARAGRTFAVTVNDDGDWLIDFDGRAVRQPTRDLLVKEVERLMRLEKRAVHIPFTKVVEKRNGYIKVKHGVATGVHSGTGNLLVAWDDGTTGQMNPNFGQETLRRLTDGEVQELTLLAKEANDAGDALRNFLNQKHVYKGDKGVVEQVNKMLAGER